MYERIVVPLDGSDLAEQALDSAEELARAFSVPMHLIRVVDYPATNFAYVYGGMIESAALTEQLEHEQAIAETYLSEVAASLSERGVAVSTEVRHGVPVQELCDTMQPSDLVVIASHGRSGVARWFLGSVAEEVIRRSRVPVLLVRATNRGGKRNPNHTALTA